VLPAEGALRRIHRLGRFGSSAPDWTDEQVHRMTRYIALLRGINVGGINIKMAALADTVLALGHTGVHTVLASGNVVFDSDDADGAALKSGLEQALSAAFDYQSWVALLT